MCIDFPRLGSVEGLVRCLPRTDERSYAYLSPQSILLQGLVHDRTEFSEVFKKVLPVLVKGQEPQSVYVCNGHFCFNIQCFMQILGTRESIRASISKALVDGEFRIYFVMPCSNASRHIECIGNAKGL